MVFGKTGRPRVFAQMLETDGRRLIDHCTKQTVALGEMPDPFRCLVRHPDMDELFELTVRRDHSQSTVLCADERQSRFHDAAEDLLEIQFLDDRTIGLQQTSQPTLRLENPLRTFDEFLDRAFEFGPRRVREVELLDHVNRLP